MREPFRKASVYITLLLILEAVIGLVIVIVTAIYQSLLTGYLAETESRMLYGFLFNIYIFGIQLIVTFLCSNSMWNRLWCRRCTPNVRLLLTVWLFYLCVIIASGVAAVWNFYRSVDVLESAAENSLIRGIDMYYSCPEWKLLWDGLQMRRQCCGVRTYKDWMNADWMPRPDDNCTDIAGSVLAPYACCKRDSDRCFANYMPGSEEISHTNSRQPFPTLSVEYINTNGCLPVYSDTLWRYIYILLVLAMLSLKVLILLCCMTKYILHRQNVGDGCDNVGLTDEEGRPLVVVKYPCNVRCITIGEDDLASDMAPDVNYCNCEEPTEDRCNAGYYEG
ncbi:CD63 antigen [Scaptodrosophila lebanonensis]|uniref:CD63 antigen n=1 Tax=Drosophila lebanonensis TaxID=7225 RepID=A0A6J2U3K9_DROLE|nr:CD63 antigen [Scaptodrosophila lebanonensis]